MDRYAWLEHEGGVWHLLTSPVVAAGGATRRWSSGRHAILDLQYEGWRIVAPYPGTSGAGVEGRPVYGYGLARTLH